MSAAILAAVLLGFARTYYLRPYFQADALLPILQVHGFLFTSWILLFLTQTTLVAVGRTDLHRRLGWAGAALAALMVPVGLVAGVDVVRRNYPASGDEALTFLTTPVSAMLVFAALVTAAIVKRRRPEAHKRLMLLATISIIDAAVARWPLAIVAASSWAFYVFTDAFIAVGVAYDLVTRRHVHAAYIWGGLLIVVAQSLRTVTGQTDAWHAIARAILQ